MQENFFVIDADNLELVHEKMYGMAFDSKSFITDINAFDEKAYRDYSGAFVAVKRKDRDVRLYQDTNGTHGIYVYEEDSYFALSNSFLLLFEYLYFTKHKTLELNYGYACHLLTMPMCSLAYASTLCSQIRILPRDTEVAIDVATKSLAVQYLEKPPLIDIYSEEALLLVDRWISKWVSLIQNLQAQERFTEVDVTGGFDSRLTLSLVLAADVDRAKFNFKSGETYHVRDDYPISQKLGKDFGFALNAQNYSGKYVNVSAADGWNLSVLTNLGTHHYPYFQNSAYAPSYFKMTGRGGETIRNHWYVEPHSLEKAMIGGDVSKRNISLHAVKFLWHELIEVNKRHQGDNADSYKTLVHLLYNEGRARYHFGRNIASAHFINYIVLAPLIDPELRRIDCLSHGNTDYDLLIALIMMRIDKRLVEIPFNDGKMFAADCIRRASEINRKKKFVIQYESFSVPENAVTFRPDSTYDNNQELPLERLKRQILCPEVKSAISRAFGSELYDTCVSGFDRQGVHPEQGAFKLLAVAKVAEPGAPVLMAFDAQAGAIDACTP